MLINVTCILVSKNIYMHEHVMINLDAGYTLDDSSTCQFDCLLNCANGECEYDYLFGSPICSCNEGFALNEAKECEFICPLNCANGKCEYNFMGEPICLCDEDFTLSESHICEKMIETSESTTQLNNKERCPNF